MSDQDEIINAPPPSAENGVTTPPPPEAVSEPNEPSPVDAVKEALAEKLRTGDLEGIDTPEPAPAAPAAEPPKAEAPPTAPSKPAEPPKAGEKPAAPADDPLAAYDDPDDLRPDEVDPKFTKIRERIQRQQAKLRQTRQELERNKQRIAPALEAGFDEDAVDDWLLLGARANLGDPAALQELAARLSAAGFKFQPAAPAAPATPEPRAPQPAKPTDAQVEAIYQRHFKPRVDSYRMDEEAAREAAAELAANMLAGTPAPAPSQPHTQVPAPAAPQAPAPAAKQDPIQTRVLASMDQMDQQYAKTVPNWDKVRALADDLVKADIKAGKKLDPLLWPSDWAQKVRLAQVKVMQEAQAASRPAVTTTDTSLRPARNGAPGASNPMDGIAAALRAGNLDALPT